MGFRFFEKTIKLSKIINKKDKFIFIIKRNGRKKTCRTFNR